MTENQRLKIIRKFLNVTQVDFGASLGLTQAGYSDIERGKNSVSGKIKILLKREHHVNLSWLETGEGEMFTASPKDQVFDSDQWTKDQGLIKILQLEIDRLQQQINRLIAENDLCSELVKSKNQIIESLESQIQKR